MNTYKDQLGREVPIASPPRRIISLVPSQTELLFDLGLDEEVIGITKFCVHPDSWFSTKTRIGGTKQIHLEQVLALQPDLVIANKEENTAEQVQYLMQHVPVWVSDVHDLDSALDMMLSIGDMTDRGKQTAQLIWDILVSFKELRAAMQGVTPLRTAYLIWREPWMAAGGDTFIHNMLQRCGLENIFRETPRYPTVDIEQLRAADCQLVLLSSEPYPFKERHIAELQAALPTTRFMLVDGEMFSWYGSRLRKAAAYFREIRKAIDDGLSAIAISNDK